MKTRPLGPAPRPAADQTNPVPVPVRVPVPISGAGLGDRDRDPDRDRVGSDRLIWTENRRTQFGWDVREALTVRLREVPDSDRSAGQRYLARVLDRVDSHAVDRTVANRTFTDVGRALFPERTFVSAHEVADRLWTKPKAALAVSFGALLRTAAPSVSPPPPRSPAAELGRALMPALFEAVPGSGAARLWDAVSFAPPFLLGRLAEVVGASSAAGLLAELEAAEPQDIEACARWLNAQAEIWLGFADQAPRYAARDVVLSRWTEGLAEAFALEPEQLRADLEQRYDDARFALDAAIERFAEVLGRPTVDRLIASLDLNAEVLAIASPADGPLIDTNLSGLGALVERTKRFMLRFADQALRDVTVTLPGLEVVFEGVDPDVRAHVLARVLLQLHPGPPSESPIDARLRVALASEGSSSAILRSLREDPGWAHEFHTLLADHQVIKAGLAEDQAQRAHRSKTLDAGVLVLPEAAVEKLRAHLEPLYPEEGLAYLATDGAHVHVFPIASRLAGQADARRLAEESYTDSAALVVALVKSGYEVLARAHSHPDEAPVFSDLDLGGSTRAGVTLARHMRTLIMQIDRDGHTRLASFSSGRDGQVKREDRIAYAEA